MKVMNGDELAAFIKERYGENVKSMRVDKFSSNGVKKSEFHSVWMRVNRGVFKDVIRSLKDLHDEIHMAVASGSDLGDEIELIYHLNLYWGERNRQLTVNVGVRIPKDDPHIPTISDLIPGALITEREKQEFLGVVVDGIPDPRRLFLAQNIPEGYYPWRKDKEQKEKMDKLYRNVHEEGV